MNEIKTPHTSWDIMIKERVIYWIDTILNSYGQIFFSQARFFTVLLCAITFFSPTIGLFGLLSVIVISIGAYFSGFDKNMLRTGLYGFNALLCGMALASIFQINEVFIIIWLIALLMVMIITASIDGFLHKYQLPFLTFPFLLTFWIISAACTHFNHVLWLENGVYTINDAIRNQGSWLYFVTHCCDNWILPIYIQTYFKTLGGCFFQSGVLAGMIISIGLLFFSRISWTLSILGFTFAYIFYPLLGADLNDLNYSLLGSNFIFMAIALGGFFVVPNCYSYLSIILLSPILVIFLVFCNKILGVFQLKAMTLPFSIISLFFLYMLRLGKLNSLLQLVTIQYYSAEKTIYKYLIYVERFNKVHFAKLALPFWGEWLVSQGYQGGITHLGYWQNALDFVVQDQENKTFQNTGTDLKDFYCYNKPILAPLDGYVYDILNIVDENPIGEVNTEQNWGNTIILNHLNGLYSQISHIKKDSFVVHIGEYVKKGTVLANCGNSGRSPEPHIHFQLQTSPTIGEVTYPYPIAYFIERNGQKRYFKMGEIPKQNTYISNIEPNLLLSQSFDFIPGTKFRVSNQTKDASSNIESEQWEVFTDAYNRSYIFSHTTKSTAYFSNDGILFYFFDFEGNKNSILFTFYLACYKIVLGYYPDIKIEDNIPLIHFNNPYLQWLQDFMAPFHLFTKVKFLLSDQRMDNINAPNEVSWSSQIQTHIFHSSIKTLEIEVIAHKNQYFSLIVSPKSSHKNYLCERY
jgi:urea transporter/murein DD-endopeptidase MepM/ murein hydrolase activator NlpD